MQMLETFAGSVSEAMGTAASRRQDAQQTLELLAAEQRKASEEMKASINQALTMMERMQGEWDSAVASNAAELRDLKSSARDTSDKQVEAVSALKARQAELASHAAQLNALTDERRSLAEEEQRLRRRYEQLRQRRAGKGGKGGLPIAMPPWAGATDLEQVAEKAGKSAEEAAIGLMRLFGKEEKKQLPPGGDDK